MSSSYTGVCRLARPLHTGVLIAILLTSLVVPGLLVQRAQAQDVGPDKPETQFNHGAFRFGADARAELHKLWSASTDAKAERVACIGGQVENGVAYVTRVQPLGGAWSDSANISAAASLEQCSPPTWFGTVHTHIARFDGQPYIIFSASDRVVMIAWRRMWKAEGVFCILYSDSEANCEAGYDLSGQALYGKVRGNNILR